MDNKNTLYHIWNKGDKFKLTDHFNSSEFECPCSKCTEQRISKELLEKLEVLRIEHNKPIKVNSGYRCSDHNIAIGGAPKSSHVDGNAADINSKDLDSLYSSCEKHFSAVGDGRKKGFIHIDTRADKQRRWTY